MIETQILYETLSGSHLYGLNEPSSDKDFIGVYMPDEKQLLGFGSLNRAKFEKDNLDDTTFYSLHHFCKLLAQNNFLVLETLFADEDKVLIMHEPFLKLREMREELIGPNILVSMRGFIKHNSNHINRRANTPARQKLYDDHGYDTKYAMHTVRLLDNATIFIETGKFRVDCSENKEKYLSIKHGCWSYDECMKIIQSLDERVSKEADKIQRNITREENTMRMLESICIDCCYKHLNRNDQNGNRS